MATVTSDVKSTVTNTAISKPNVIGDRQNWVRLLAAIVPANWLRYKRSFKRSTSSASFCESENDLQSVNKYDGSWTSFVDQAKMGFNALARTAKDSLGLEIV